MAFALPGAIGAQLSYPDRVVFALAGDGGFAMLMADFVTAVRENLPLIAIVLNNSKYAFIALEQNAKGLPEHSIDLRNPDFAGFAKGCGGLGIRVEQPGEIRPALESALAEKCPAVIDVTVNPDEIVMPPRINLGEAANFAYARIRELLP